MTLKELEARVAALENEVGQLRERLPTAAGQRHWWHDEAGRFENDPVFDEIVRLGKEYRDSLRPGRGGRLNEIAARATRRSRRRSRR
jgi:hypothetical protein